MRMAVLRIGRVDTDIAMSVQNGLCEAFPNAKCEVLNDVMVLPEEAYSASRKQYHSTVVLSKISDYVKKVDFRLDHVLGIVNADLYVPRLNFVFGEAECPGKTAIISLFRLSPQFYGFPAKRELLFEHSIKEAVHEVGHTLGLGHCSNQICVMFFSNSILDTDKKSWTFCEKCCRLVDERLSQRP